MQLTLLPSFSLLKQSFPLASIHSTPLFFFPLWLLLLRGPQVPVHLYADHFCTYVHPAETLLLSSGLTHPNAFWTSPCCCVTAMQTQRIHNRTWSHSATSSCPVLPVRTLPLCSPDPGQLSVSVSLHPLNLQVFCSSPDVLASPERSLASASSGSQFGGYLL